MFGGLILFGVVSATPVVCIDPGHVSEVGAGTRGKHITEVKVAWLVGLRLRTVLESRGFKVVMTKSSEGEFVRNRRRAETANDAQALLMVRLHCDANSGTGFATYFPDRQGVSEGTRGPSEELIGRIRPIAERFHKALAGTLAGVLRDNGLKGDEETAVGSRQGALTGSIFSKVPVVLVEMVVLTNPKDEAFISTRSGQEKMAEALADGVVAGVGGSSSR